MGSRPSLLREGELGQDPATQVVAAISCTERIRKDDTIIGFPPDDTRWSDSNPVATVARGGKATTVDARSR